VVHVVPGTELSGTDLSKLQDNADYLLSSLAELRLD
jgi:hypothetical protein